MEKYTDHYHEKFNRAYAREFTGRIFNPVEFLHHLDNINFRFESGEISKLSDTAIEKIRSRFRFYRYFGYVDGLVSMMDASYEEKFRKFVNGYGEKYGFRRERTQKQEA